MYMTGYSEKCSAVAVSASNVIKQQSRQVQMTSRNRTVSKVQQNMFGELSHSRETGDLCLESELLLNVLLNVLLFNCWHNYYYICECIYIGRVFIFKIQTVHTFTAQGI